VQSLGRSNSATVEQYGLVNNWSFVDQTQSIASIRESGYGPGINVSVLYQNAALGANVVQDALEGSNTSYINQTGGTINVTETANSGANASSIWQTSGTATTTITQTIDLDAIGGSNNSSIRQDSVTGNEAITQKVMAGGGTNTSYISQTRGTYTVTQTANDGTNNSFINSIDGTSTVLQEAALGGTNTSNINQIGSNTADVTQRMTASVQTNTSTITQTGSGNYAKVTQH
jgi:hypothetical protein